MKSKAIIAALALAAGFAAPAVAQQADQVIRFLDKDGDGKCSLNEYLAFQVTKLEQFDEDKDGAMTLPEFRNSLEGEGKRNAPASFKAFNREGGRTLTQKEYLSYHFYVFSTFVDTDKDGFMSAAEWAKLMGQG